MIQKINFYQYMEHPIRSSIDLKKFFYITISFALLLAALQYFMDSARQAAEKSLALSAANLQTAVHALQEEQKKYALLTGQSSLIVKDICKVKPSDYFKAFARAHVKGLWLTDINISNSGTELRLMGRATQTSQVNLYIEGLKNQPIFSKFQFELSNLTGLKTGNQVTEAGLFNVSIVGKASL